MSFARFLNFGQTDYSGVTGFTPNLDLLKNLADSTQEEIDLADAIVDKIPEYAPSDYDFVQQHANKIAAERDRVTNIYATKGVQAGNRALRDLKRQTTRMWQPTGAYGRVSATKKAYDEAKNRLLTAKDIEGSYRDARLKKLDSEFYTGIKTEGGYRDNQFNTPTERAITPFFDLNKEAPNLYKNLKAVQSNVSQLVKNNAGEIIGVNNIGEEVMSAARVKKFLNGTIKANPLYKDYSATRKEVGIDTDQNLLDYINSFSTGVAYKNTSTSYKPTATGKGKGKKINTEERTSNSQPTVTIKREVQAVGVDAGKQNTLNMRKVYAEQEREDKVLTKPSDIEENRNVKIEMSKSNIDVKGGLGLLADFTEGELLGLEDSYQTIYGNIDDTLGVDDTMVPLGSFIRDTQNTMEDGTTVLDFVQDKFFNKWISENVTSKDELNKVFPKDENGNVTGMNIGALSNVNRKSMFGDFHNTLANADAPINSYNDLVQRRGEVENMVEDELNNNLTDQQKRIKNGTATDEDYYAVGKIGRRKGIFSDEAEKASAIEELEKQRARLKELEDNPEYKSGPSVGERFAGVEDRSGEFKDQYVLTINRTKSTIEGLEKKLKGLKDITLDDKTKENIRKDIIDPIRNKARDKVYDTYYGDDVKIYPTISFVDARHSYDTLVNTNSTSAKFNELQKSQVEYISGTKASKNKDDVITSGSDIGKFDKIISLSGELMQKEEFAGFINTPGLTYDVDGRWMLHGRMLLKDGTEQDVFAYSKAHDTQLRGQIGNLNPEQMQSYINVSLDRMEDSNGVYEDTGILGNQGLKLRYSKNKSNGLIEVRVQDYAGNTIVQEPISGATSQELSTNLLEALGPNFNSSTFDNDINWSKDITYFNHKQSPNTPSRVNRKGIIDEGQVEVKALDEGFANELKALDNIFSSNYLIASMIRSHQNNANVGGSATSAHLFGKAIDVSHTQQLEQDLANAGVDPTAMREDHVKIPGTNLEVLLHKVNEGLHFDIRKISK